MNIGVEFNEFAEQRQLSYRIFQEKIHKHARVLVTGPNVTPYNDPSLLWAASWVTEGGNVFIADPQNYGVPKDDAEKCNLSVASVTGVGDVATHQRYLAVMREAGLPMADVTWLGRESLLWFMPGLDRGAIDAIIDHYTSAFVIGGLGAYGNRQEELWGNIVAEYHRVLKSGGVLLLQVDDHRTLTAQLHITSDGFTKILEKGGFSVTRHYIQDEVHIPVSVGVLEQLRRIAQDKSRGDDASIAASYGYGVRLRNGNAEFIFSPTYFCPQLLIAIKR